MIISLTPEIITWTWKNTTAGNTYNHTHTQTTKAAIYRKNGLISDNKHYTTRGKTDNIEEMTELGYQQKKAYIYI